jgi:hypothetical protein
MKRGSSNLHSILTVVSLALTFACSSAHSADPAANDLSSTDAANVVKLETKLFDHPYEKDTAQHRLDRLEKSVFGEAKSGAVSERLSALMQAVPNLDMPKTAEHRSSPANAREADRPPATADRTAESNSQAQPNSSEDDAMGAPGNYPAVTAIEKKVLGKSYDSEPVGERLARVETRVFGKPSTSTDMSDRVDRLKQRTGVDLAKQAAPGSDWSDDDDDNFGMPPRRTANRGSSQGYSRDDLSAGSQAQGDYGSSGFGDMVGAGEFPAAAPPRLGSSRSSDSYSSGLGLNQKVTALELEILGKSYARETLPARLNRLESTVFPKQAPSTGQPLPDRVDHLLAVVPLSSPQMSRKTHSSNDDDLDFPDTMGSTNNQMAQSGTQQKSSGGLSKIISSLGNMISGGSMGGFSSGGTYMTDPRTGMMIDKISGNIIDPNTGTVIGNTGGSMYNQGYGSPYGLGSMNSFGSFNNGFSPFGSPMMGSPLGGYGSGMRFGFGGGRMGGMWP